MCSCSCLLQQCLPTYRIEDLAPRANLKCELFSLSPKRIPKRILKNPDLRISTQSIGLLSESEFVVIPIVWQLCVIQKIKSKK